MKGQVQRLDAEPANGEVVQRQVAFDTRQQPSFRLHQRIVGLLGTHSTMTCAS
jgi:hypothetical protein